MQHSRSSAFQALAREIARQLGAACAPEPERSVSGGSIHRCYQWRCDAGPLFVKVADAQAASALQAEAAGLLELAAARAVRIPRVRARGLAEGWAFLALEWIESRHAGRDSERKLGERLAAQHGITAAQFGWRVDNTIGRTRQLNAWLGDWPEFFRERRLRYQLDLAVRRGFARQLERPGERLLEKVGMLLKDHHPVPSLLHGDLWGGNWFADEAGEPVIFDPAVYYGDREADLAMTQLFGGFGRAFYAAYQSAWPLSAGHALRIELYNLYHVLNHANLFGGGYAEQARAMIERLLAETGG